MHAALDFKSHRDPAHVGRVTEEADETGFRRERLRDTLELRRASSGLQKAHAPHLTLEFQHSPFAPSANQSSAGDTLENQSRTLATLRGSAVVGLPKLLSGELSVAGAEREVSV